MGERLKAVSEISMVLNHFYSPLIPRKVLMMEELTKIHYLDWFWDILKAKSLHLRFFLKLFQLVNCNFSTQQMVSTISNSSTALIRRSAVRVASAPFKFYRVPPGCTAMQSPDVATPQTCQFRLNDNEEPHENCINGWISTSGGRCRRT